MHDLARTIKTDHTTGPSQARKFTLMEKQTFGRAKAEIGRMLPDWCLRTGRTNTEQILLNQIVIRSKIEEPWTWHDRHGATSMAEYLGIGRASFFRAVSSLTDDGLLLVTRIAKQRSTYRVPDEALNEIRGRGNVFLQAPKD